MPLLAEWLRQLVFYYYIIFVEGFEVIARCKPVIKRKLRGGFAGLFASKFDRCIFISEQTRVVGRREVLKVFNGAEKQLVKER